MNNVHSWKKVHLVGIGGINMSAVAKLLLKAGVTVTGSDLYDSELSQELVGLGIKVAIGSHDERNVPSDCQGVIHTSAAPDTNPERVAASHRGLQDVSNFEFMGEWFKDKKVILVTGTHGKSTTTAMLGNMCIASGLDPTVIVGSRVPGWPDANLRMGQSDLVIIEGDEYARHFLSFHPSGLIINNIELDHTDIFKDVDDLRHAFERLLRQTKKGSTVVVNAEYPEAMKAVATIKLNGLKIVDFGEASRLASGNPAAPIACGLEDGKTWASIRYGVSELKASTSQIGRFNAFNLAAAMLMARDLGASDEAIVTAAKDFPGIWRRMESVGNRDGVPVYSDYAHHPTAVRESLAGLRASFPDKRIILCYQPHHKNRTKHLFNELSACFDQADALVLCEIYDVAGRSAAEDVDMTSLKLLDAVKSRLPADSPLKLSEYAPDPIAAVKMTFDLLKPGDICVFMGAGDIDAALRKGLKQAVEVSS